MKAKGAISLSQELLYKVKLKKSADQEIEELARYPLDGLLQDLPGDNEKKAFWINLYNAFSTRIIRKNPEKITVFTKKIRHFNKKQLRIARHSLSLNDLEHGMLRHSKIPWSKGYLEKFWVNGFEREFRVSRVDPRIHFALNCGARSCPPIKFYEVDKIDEQLDMATKAFLLSESEMTEREQLVKVTRLFEMFKADFGGRKGIRKFLQQYGIIPEGTSPRIVFKPYQWEPDLDPFD